MDPLKRQDGMYFIRESIPASQFFAAGSKEAELALIDEKLASMQLALGPPLLELLENKGPHMICVEVESDYNIVTESRDIILTATIVPVDSWRAKFPAHTNPETKA